MISQTFEYTAKQALEDEIAQNTKMFFEADRLDAHAYKLIEAYSGDAVTCSRFTQAKRIADAQRTAAYHEWMRIKRAARG